MKKLIIAATACFAAGVVGLAVSLPKVAGNAVELYNEVVSGYSENLYERQSLPASTTTLRVLNHDAQRMGQVLVTIDQSPDAQIHFYSFDGPWDEFPVEVQSQDTHGTIVIQDSERKKLLINEETVKQAIYAELNYDGAFILEVPNNVLIENTASDNVYFDVQPGVEFVNADLIRQYGYIPNQEDTWESRYHQLEQENQMLQEQLESLWTEHEILQESYEAQMNHGYDEGSSETTVEQPLDGERLIFPTDIIMKEEELNQHRGALVEGTVSKEEYLQKMEKIIREAQEMRTEQLSEAAREELIPMVEEVYLLMTEYYQVDAMILEAQRSYNQSQITQKQYNKLMESYSSLLKKQDLRIQDRKQSLEQSGYSWDVASIH